MIIKVVSKISSTLILATLLISSFSQVVPVANGQSFQFVVGPEYEPPSDTTLPPQLAQLIERIIRTLQTIAFSLAIICIIIGGYYFITAGGSQEKVEIGRRFILYAGIGLAVITIAELLARTACWLATGRFSCPGAR